MKISFSLRPCPPRTCNFTYRRHLCCPTLNTQHLHGKKKIYINTIHLAIAELYKRFPVVCFPMDFLRFCHNDSMLRSKLYIKTALKEKKKKRNAETAGRRVGAGRHGGDCRVIVVGPHYNTIESGRPQQNTVTAHIPYKDAA